MSSDSILKGYDHPESLNVSRYKRYKTYSDGDEFGNPKGYDTYKTINTHSDDLCPSCEGSPIKVCNCIYNDKTCNNGHVWYTKRDGTIGNTNPH